MKTALCGRLFSRTSWTSAAALMLVTGGLAAEARGAAYAVYDQASCEGLPAATVWAAGSECQLNGNFTLVSGDTLEIQSPVRLTVTVGNTLTNEGSITVPNGGKLRALGALENQNGGAIDSAGFFDLRDGGVFNNGAGSETITSNQLHVTQGTLTNAGTIRNDGPIGVLTVGLSSTVENTGTLVNSGTITNRGAFTNDNQLDNLGTFNNECGNFVNNGTVTGNPVNDPFCWIGGSGPLWSTGANWNHGSAPPTDVRVVIQSGPEPHIDFTLAFAGTLEIQINDLYIDVGGELINDGIVSTQGGNFPGSSVLINEGNFVNNGIVRINDRVDNRGTAVNNGDFVPTGALGTIFNSGSFTNAAAGTLTCGLNNQTGGSFQNLGAFNMNRLMNENAGQLSNGGSAFIEINNALLIGGGGVLENDGIVNVNHLLTHPGRIENGPGGSILNRESGTLNVTAVASEILNEGNIENHGSMDNQGSIDNSGTICGNPITGNPVLGIPPEPVCAEQAAIPMAGRLSRATLLLLIVGVGIQAIRRRRIS